MNDERAPLVPDEEIDARVARGAAWLDEKYPGWTERIDLTTLDIAETGVCVLTQASGSGYFAAVREQGLSHTDQAENGFLVWQSDYSDRDAWKDDFTRITAAWQVLIEKRRAPEDEAPC